MTSNNHTMPIKLMDTTLAWYFAPPENRLRYKDNRLVRVGTTHSIKGNPILCQKGLHASVRIIDALTHASTHILYRVELSGKMDKGNDKIAAQSRRYIKRYDIKDVLFEFSRNQALLNIKKIKPYSGKENYSLILKWLNTGDKFLRSAAESAAWDAAWSAAGSAAWSAAAWSAKSAAWSAKSAAGSAAWSAAAWSARSAAAAAESAAESAAGSAAESAAESAAKSAAWSAAGVMLIEMISNKFGPIEKQL